MARKVGLDDFLFITAWLAETVVVASVKLMFEKGIGWHARDITLPDAVAILTEMVLVSSMLWPRLRDQDWQRTLGLGSLKSSTSSV